MALIPSTSSPPSSSPFSSPRWKYDVFLSFRGEDTRKNFTDHLYAALIQKGIATFRDDEKLERGVSIVQELLKAIEESKFAIIILSKHYASSKWCSIELTKIVECMENTGLVVLPIFHYVDPSDIRNQRETFAEAFVKHEECFKDNIENMQKWKVALTKVADLAGWDLKDKHEAKVVQEIIGRIYSELHCKFLSVSEYYVGMDSCVEEMLDSYLGEGSGNVRFVGICGMGGIGKTTLAQEIYNRISKNFEGSSFIANIREETKNQGLVPLQKQLLSKIFMESEINIWNFHEGINVIRNRLRNRKVFIVLDDVNEEEQLEALAGKHDWFGPGSRIIVTSRDKHILSRWGANDIYSTKSLDNNDALHLFSWKAFKKPHPEESYVDLTKEFVNYAKGLPLALKVLGSSLFAKTKDEWKSALDKLKVEPNRSILNILQISFDGLMDTQKELFLDIACFFKGLNKDYISNILQSFPDYNIGVLRDKSLIAIDNKGTLWMHDLVQEMGQEIVRRESPKEPGGRSRLWLYEDALHVLMNNTGTEVIEGIMLNTSIQKEEHLSAEAFSKMKKLRLLRIGNMQLPQGLNYLSNELRVLEWHGYPLRYIPTSFQPKKLVELRMNCSSIKQLWKGIMILDELKLIDLSDSQNLVETPDLSGVPNLKQLILRGCTRLSKLHASIGNHKQLIQLDLNGCKCIQSLPPKINLEALEIFNLGGCSRLKRFPEIVGNMSHVLELYLNETTIKELPLLVEHLDGLTKLDLRDCKNLSNLQIASGCLTSLKTLILSGCSKLDELPENLGNFEGLVDLDVSGTAIRRLPSSISLLKNLKTLSLSGCEWLSPKSSNKLLNFSLMRRRSLDPMGMSMLVHTLSSLWSLTNLDLSYCNIQEIPDVLGCLSSLRDLNLTGNEFVFLPKSIIQLSNLKKLALSGCTNLQSLSEFPINVRFIDANGCTSLETLLVRQKHGFYPCFNLLNCIKLINNQCYGDIILTMLRQYSQTPYSAQKDLLIPGSEIPKWFTHQSVGASVNLQGPSNFTGIAAIFVLQPNLKFTNIHYICNIINRLGVREKLSMGHNLTLFGKIDSCHLWLKYIAFKDFQKRNGNYLKGMDGNRLSQIVIKFFTQDPDLEITRCGGRLVYEQDFEDLKQTMAGCNSYSITPYEDNIDDSTKDIKTKRSHDDVSNGADIPELKRVRLPNLIQRFIPRLGNWIENSSTQGQGNSDCEKEES